MDRNLETLLADAAGWAGVDATTASRAMFARLQPLGLRAFASRVYRRPLGPLQSDRLWKAGGFVVTLAPPGWEGSADHHYICLENNPLIEAPRRRLEAFRFSALAPPATALGARYWEAFAGCGVTDGIGLLAYAAGGRVASLSLCFSDMTALSEAEQGAITLVGRALLARLLAADGDGFPPLTEREIEVMQLLCDGLTEAHVAARLQLQRSTVRTHAENARRKLDAVNRAQAIARFVAWEGRRN